MAETSARRGCAVERRHRHLGLGRRRCATPAMLVCWRCSSRRSSGALLYAFFRTNLGTAMQAAGDNAQMIRALGVNVENMIVLGLARVQRPGRAVGRAARAVPGLRRRADGHRHGRLGPGQHHHRRGAGRRAAARLRHHRRGDGLGALPPAGRHRAARRAQPQRPEAGHGRLRVRSPSCCPGWSRGDSDAAAGARALSAEAR